MPEPLSRAALRLMLRYQLRRSMSRLGVRLPLGRQSLPPTRHRADVALVRHNGQVQLGLPAEAGHVAFTQRKSITAYLYLFAHCSPAVRSMTCACSDGHEASDARFTPSSRSARAIPVPDRYFIFRDGFRAERALAETASLPWHERRDGVVWRGCANGDGIHPQLADDGANMRVIQRARLCLLAASVPGIDARLVAGHGEGRTLNAFSPLGIVGAPRAEEQWLGDKFAIDIDGWTNAWSNLLIRLHFGCCVLKVASADGYRQWWYDRLRPWEHYVPVRADLSDLPEQLDWVRAHDRQAQAIAARGQHLARTMTLAAETAIAAATIEQHWDTP